MINSNNENQDKLKKVQSHYPGYSGSPQKGQ